VTMDPTKVESIQNARAPSNASELKSFLGLATFCSRFIPDFSSLTGPLRELLKKNNVFKWKKRHEVAFVNLKKEMSKQACLTYFDPAIPCKLITGASNYGIGAVLVQPHNGIDKSIAFASKSLTELEQKYATTEKECLALVYGVQRFHNYLYGKPFLAYVDHKSLESLMNNFNKRGNARIERWNLILQNQVTIIKLYINQAAKI